MAFSEAQLAAAAEVAEELGLIVEAEPTTAPSVQSAPEAPAATAVAQPEAPAPTDDEFVIAGPVSDEDLEELGLLETDDDDQPVAEATDDEPDDFEDEADRLRRELAKERRRREHAEQLRARDNSAKWAKEAAMRFPYANLNGIDATSKRAYLRAAALSHNSNYAALRPLIESLSAARARLASEASVDARAAAAEAWGKPTTGPGVAPLEAGEAQAKLNEARRTGSLTNSIKALLDADVRFNPFAN